MHTRACQQCTQHDAYVVNILLVLMWDGLAKECGWLYVACYTQCAMCSMLQTVCREHSIESGSLDQTLSAVLLDLSSPYHKCVRSAYLPQHCLMQLSVFVPAGV